MLHRVSKLALAAVSACALLLPACAAPSDEDAAKAEGQAEADHGLCAPILPEPLKRPSESLQKVFSFGDFLDLSAGTQGLGLDLGPAPAHPLGDFLRAALLEVHERQDQAVVGGQSGQQGVQDRRRLGRIDIVVLSRLDLLENIGVRQRRFRGLPGLVPPEVVARAGGDLRNQCSSGASPR